MIDTSKVIHAPVGGGRYTVTAPITQWDYGYLFVPEIDDLPATYRLDFSNEEHNGTALPVYGNADGAEVPETLIDTGKDIFVWYFFIGEDYGKSVYKWRIPNKCKPRTSEDEPTPSQQSSIDQLIARSNEAVTSAERSATDADASAQSASADADRAEEARTDAQNYAEQAEQSVTDAHEYASQASASATASAQSAEQSAINSADAQDSAEEAQGYASASAQSATASANSASQASASATSASQSATSAQGYASQAQTSAQTASSKATEASTSAQTASQKATESAQSASQALIYKTDAQTAKTDAQTAQGLAESARDSAQGYASDAQGYAEDAQASAESISASASQIAQNTSDIASLEEDRYKPYVTDSASGSIASFPDGADDIPLKSLVVDIDPVQDLHGQDAPYPAGGGKNLFNKDDSNSIVVGYIGAPAFANTNQNAYTVYVPISPNTTYTVSKRAGTRFQVAASPYVPANGVTFTNRVNGSTAASITITSGEGDAYLWAWVFLDGTDTGTLDEMLATVQIEKGSTATSYAPYENICPISGWEGMQLSVNGTVIPISWQSEAGTVYGGKLDVLSGVLRVEMGVLDMSTASWTLRDDTHRATTTAIKNLIKIPSSQSVKSGSIAENYTEVRASINLTVGKFAVIQTGSVVLYYDGVNAPSGKMVYPLVEPIEIQLTPQQISSLLGVNNIWADTGDTEVEYRADPDLYIQRKMPEVPVDDVQINGQSIVSDGVANVPIASANNVGLVKILSANGIYIDNNNDLALNKATDSQIKNGSASFSPIVPANQHNATFFGLAKSAGDTTQSQSSNAVGNYTDEAKVAIQKMLGIYEAPYRLIKTIEITEETGTITIVADDNGDAFALTDVIVFFEAMVANGTSNGIVSLNNDTLADRPFVTLANLYNTTAQTRDAKLSVDGGRFIGWSSGNTFTNSYSAISLQQNKNACGIIQHDVIDTLIINSLNSHKFTSGTITIYGR